MAHDVHVLVPHEFGHAAPGEHRWEDCGEAGRGGGEFDPLVVDADGDGHGDFLYVDVSEGSWCGRIECRG